MDCSQNGGKVSNKSSSGSLSSWGVEAETSIQGNMPPLVCKHGYHLKASKQPVGMLVCKITWHRLQCPLVVGMLLHNTAMMSGRQDSSHCFIVRQKARGNSHHCSPARGWGNSHHCSPLTRGWSNSHHCPPEGGATVTNAHQRVGQQSPLLTAHQRVGQQSPLLTRAGFHLLGGGGGGGGGSFPPKEEIDYIITS